MSSADSRIHLDFTARDLAEIMFSKDYSQRTASRLLSYFFEERRYLLSGEYRHDRRKLFLDVFYWMDYLSDQDQYNKEFDVIAEDAAASGRVLDEADYIAGGTGPEFLFKSIFFRLQYSSEDYCRIKMRTIMKRYGYKRRTKGLVEQLDACIQHYRLVPYVHREAQMDFRKIESSQIIVFRLR